jgi:myo-inositol-1(or 4)-monophosphatase
VDEVKDFIINMAKDAGDLSLEMLGIAKISSKGGKDIVTEADTAVEKLIISRIKEKYPDHNIVAEESDNIYDKSKPTWYIDPIDGTANYAKGDQNYAISIAYYGEKKIGCLNIPMTGEMYYAETGKGTELNGKKIQVSDVRKVEESVIQLGMSIRHEKIDDSLAYFRYFSINAWRTRDFGFGAGQLAFVAAGRSDGIIKMSQHPWDMAAGIVLVEEAGGKVTDDYGRPVVLGDSKARHNVVASNGHIQDELIKIMNTDLKNIDRESPWN